MNSNIELSMSDIEELNDDSLQQQKRPERVFYIFNSSNSSSSKRLFSKARSSLAVFTHRQLRQSEQRKRRFRVLTITFGWEVGFEAKERTPLIGLLFNLSINLLCIATLTSIRDNDRFIIK